MKKIIYTITILTITIAIVGFVLNMIFGQNTVTYFSVIRINGVTMYKYDFLNYAKNIENTFKNVAELEMTWPERLWIDPGSNWTDSQFWDAIVNNLAYMLDIFIGVANIFLYPIRIAFYAIQSILAVIGLPTMNPDGTGLEWLINLCKWITQLTIPYV